MARGNGSTMALTVALTLASASAAWGGAQHVKTPLHATAAAPDARGRAKLSVRGGAHGRFAVAARRLAPDTTYDVVVAGIKVGSLTSRKNGAGKLAFAAPKRGGAALLGFDPRGASVVVRNAGGDDVLEGDMPDGSDDPNAVACCVPDDGRTECKDRTPEECLAMGGEVSSATGCFPDPCAPTTGVVCCLGDSAAGAFCDDGPEVECEDDFTAEGCAAKGGTVVEAPSCESDPCKPVPPADLVVCCVPEDDDEVECEIKTPERCARHGGTVSSAKSCAENPCGASSSGDDDQGEDGDDQGGDGGGHHGGDD